MEERETKGRKERRERGNETEQKREQNVGDPHEISSPQTFPEFPLLAALQS